MNKNNTFFRLIVTGMLLCVFITVYASGDQYILKHWATNDALKEQLVKFAQQSYRDTYHGLFTDKELNELFTPEYFDPAHNQMFMVLVNNNNIIGYAKLIFEKQARIKLDKLYVSSNYQGKGLGKSLLHTCFYEAIKKGYLHISLIVWTKNTRAVEFYAQHGFKVSPDLVRYYKQDGTPTDEYDYIMTGDLRSIAKSEKIKPIKPCNKDSSELCVLQITD